MLEKQTKCNLMFHTIIPREQGGRLALERFDCQIKSTVIACLEILEESEVQRIYCEFHDDLVIQRVKDSLVKYDFVQVKTDKNIGTPWNLNRLFGINTTRGGSLTPYSFRNSFIGKLVLHIVKFGPECNSVIFQTNMTVDEKVESIVNSIEKGDRNPKWMSLIVESFNASFPDSYREYTDQEIMELLRKIELQEDVPYLKLKNSTYQDVARSKIYEYSEIDLGYRETREIIIKLEDLVFRKSKGPLSEFSYSEIEEKTSISLDDLLKVLAISKDAYLALKSGGDLKAIKNASIIQRTLVAAGVTEESIAYCSECKILWDNWIRDSRLDFLDVQSIAGIVDSELNRIIDVENKLKLNDLRKAVNRTLKKLKKKKLLFDLEKDQVLGAFFSQIVKIKS